MSNELRALMTEYLSTEYSEEEIGEMLATAHVERVGDQVIALYDNGVTETMEVKYKPYLVQLTNNQI